MRDRIQTPPPQPSTKPRPNQILAEPATVAACNADYEAGTAQRNDSAKQDTAPRQGSRR
jgi:hypothetical protein